MFNISKLCKSFKILKCAVSVAGNELWVFSLNFLLSFKVAIATTGRVAVAITLGPFHPSPVLALREVYTCLLAVQTRSFSCLSVFLLKCAIWVEEICCVIFTTSLKQNKPRNHLPKYRLPSLGYQPLYHYKRNNINW